jgi:hypothetical protein
MKEELKKRDLLWCKALTQAGLDLREISKVLAKFNRMRPKEEKSEDS